MQVFDRGLRESIFGYTAPCRAVLFVLPFICVPSFVFPEVMISRNVYTSALFCATALVVFSSSCGSKSDGQKEDQHSRAVSDTISIAQAEQIIDSQTSATMSQEGFQIFVENQARFSSDTAACNRGAEAFRDFVGRFTSDPNFRKTRVTLHDASCQLPANTEGNIFEQKKPDEDGFFSAWSVMEQDSVVFCTGWLNSEVAEEYTFIRKSSGLWYLVDYFNINNLQ